ncbi:MAG: NAD(P)-binding domain-containing protein, partial [Curvibacter sp.]|nr:NAD(P)-binding domain-containing protein [Curvibacter sp.]
FEGSQMLYHDVDEARVGGQRVLVVGHEEPAVQAAVQAARSAPGPAARSVTLLHRKDDFEASEEWLGQLRSLREQGRIRVAIGQPIGLQTHGEGEGQRLTGLVIATPDDTETTLPLDLLLPRLGLSPRLGPLAHWGLAMERKLLPVDPATFSTAEAGLYAVGDINHYLGKRKLILCGFHEATLAAFAAAERLHPDQPVRLQYTTTSTQLHQRLGLL